MGYPEFFWYPEEKFYTLENQVLKEELDSFDLVDESGITLDEELLAPSSKSIDNTVRIVRQVSTTNIREELSNENSFVATSAKRRPRKRQTRGAEEKLRLYCPTCDSTTLKIPYKNQTNCLSCNSQYLYQCAYCDNRYDTKETARTHMYYERYNRLRQSECPHCHRFYSNKYLALHIQYQHSEMRFADRHKCPDCSTVVKTRHGLLAHRRLVCGKKDKPYKCQHCSFCSKYSQNVTEHVLTAHRLAAANEFKYTCSKCGRGYKYQAGYKRHVEVNCCSQESDEFSCDLCGFKCAQRYGMLRHMTDAHSSS